MERRKEILKFNVIQGTTYTALPFLAFPVPVVSHFGSTTQGFLDATPTYEKLERDARKIWKRLEVQGAIKELNVATRRPMNDIAEIEEYVATRATACVATSQMVANELLAMGVAPEKIHLIHNALEDYWFSEPPSTLAATPSIVFLGRLGGDVFTLKLKGLDRLIQLYQTFPAVPKYTFCITDNKPLTAWLRHEIPQHTLAANVPKVKLPELLRPLRGSVLFIPSRYEGFSLSLIEGMSQGLIPIVYRVGIAPEVIRNGHNGFLVDSPAEAMRRANEILKSAELREQLSTEALQSARQFSGDVIAKRLVDLYTQICPNANQKNYSRE